MEDEERLERYRQFVAETEGRDISLQDAERELKVTALYIVSQSWQDNLDDPKSLGAETFLKGESQNLSYIASNGSKHGLLVATQAEREDDFINLEYYNDVRKSLSEVLPGYDFKNLIEDRLLRVAGVHGAINELVATVEDALDTIDAVKDPETYAKIEHFAQIAEDDPELAKALILEAALTVKGGVEIALQKQINRHALYEDQKRIYVGNTAAAEDFLSFFNPAKKVTGVTGLAVAIVTALPNRKLGLPDKKTGDLAKDRTVNFDPKQIQKKYTKHAKDFGVTGNYNKVNADKFQSAVDAHVKSPDVKSITGTYRGDSVTHYIDPKTGLNAMKDSAGNFISGWKLNPAQLKNVIERGKL